MTSKRDWESPEYKRFRRLIRARDKHCKMPGCYSRYKLHVHHIIPWAKAPLIRYYIGNGILLCKKHHDSIKGKEGFYAEMFIAIIQSK